MSRRPGPKTKLMNLKLTRIETPPAVDAASARIHYRRCHVCSHVSEVVGSQVNKCGECGKSMAPFFFFDEAEAQPLSDALARPEPKSGDRAPIWGFTAFW